MYKSHHITDSNGFPSSFLLTLAHRLFITQAQLTSLNSFLITLPIALLPKATKTLGLPSVLRNSFLLFSTLALAVSLPERSSPNCSWLAASLYPGLCSNVTSFKKPFPPSSVVSPALPCLHPSIFNLLYFSSQHLLLPGS